MIPTPVSAKTTLQLGSLIAITESIANNPVGTAGIIYHHQVSRSEGNGLPEHDIHSVSVLLENGHDIGVFTAAEADASFDVIGYYPLQYGFTTPAQLQTDYAAGRFTPCFSGVTTTIEPAWVPAESTEF